MRQWVRSILNGSDRDGDSQSIKVNALAIVVQSNHWEFEECCSCKKGGVIELADV